MSATTKVSYAQALAEALRMEMHRDNSIVCIASPDRFECSPVLTGLAGAFGPDRLVAVPCQARPVSIAAGFGARGKRPVCELDAQALGPDALAPLGELGNDGTIVLRLCCGGPVPGGRATPVDGRLLDTPGLAVSSPSCPADAKGMLAAALQRGGASCLVEPEGLFGEVGDVPEGAHVVPIDRACVTAHGTVASIFTYGAGVALAREAIASASLEVELIDLRSLRPLDVEAIVGSVARTGKAVVIEQSGASRIGSEVARVLLEEAFERLDGPLCRLELDLARAWEPEVREAAVGLAAERIGGLVSY